MREDQGLTQADFGRPLDLSQENIKDIEIGRKKVTPEIALKVEEVYGADFRWIMVGVSHLVREGGERWEKASDPLKEKIDLMLDSMTEEQKRDVLKYAQEKKLLSELMEERQKKKAG